MKDIKFYIGPMTKNIVEAVINYCEYNDYKIGLIPSRRQIDYDGGYVGWNTKDFLRYVKAKTGKVIVERDHSGIGQGYSYDNGVMSQYSDALHGMDMIHVDPWKKYRKYQDGLRETIDNIRFINSVNDKCLFEVGTEESIRRFETDEFENFLYDLKKELGDVFYKIKYGVIQSGTGLLGTENVGTFNIDRCVDMSKICKNFGLLSKEHNGDYLTNNEISMRFDNGLDSINIAPEFGVFETKLIMEHIKDNDIYDKIYDICYKSNRWVKWVDDRFVPEDNKDKLIEICGHYVNDEIKKLSGIDDKIIISKLIEEIDKLINLKK